MIASKIMTKALLDAARPQQPQEPSDEGQARLHLVCPRCNGAGKVPFGQHNGRFVTSSGCDGTDYL